MSELFRPRVSTVKGISDRRRLPRLGKIRLGVKVPLAGRDPKKCDCKGSGCFRCTRPTETDYFVCPSEVRTALKCDRPKKLNVMFLVNDPAVVFPQAMKYFGNSKGLKCTGDGEKAYFVDADTGEMKQRECPCPLSEDHPDPNNPGKIIKAQCNLRASLLVTLPDVNMGGIYQIDVGSYNSIIDVNSGIDTCRALIQQSLGVDRFAMIPLTLERVPTETHHDGKKQTHYTLRLTPNLTLADIQQLQKKAIVAPQQFALPEPEEIRPDLDGPVVNGDAKELLAPAEEPTPEPPAPPKTGGDDTELDRALAPDAATAAAEESTSLYTCTVVNGTNVYKCVTDQARKTVRSKIALAWRNICAQETVDIKDAAAQEQSRHKWVETFYDGKQGITELNDTELVKLYRVLSMQSKDSAEKLEKISEWLKLKRDLFVPVV